MGIPGYGAILAMDDQQAVDFTNIAEVVNFSGPTISADTEDVTHHESPGAYREKVVTLLNAGQVTFDLNFDPAGATHNNVDGLLERLENRTVEDFMITWPDQAATVWKFTAFVVGFEPDAPVDGKLAASVSLEITGQPTLA
ncbi:hypothetical protein ES705_07272 [subsurface metagenome]